MSDSSAPATTPLPASRGFLGVLLLAALFDLLLRVRIHFHYHHSKYAPNLVLDVSRNVLKVIFVVLFVLLVLYLVWGLCRWGWHYFYCNSRHLRSLAVLVSAMTFVNLISENIAIYRLNLASYSLLFESFCLYLSVTFVFLFWYWYADQPPPQLASTPYGIIFPEELIEHNYHDAIAWKPVFTDYLYFTILSSNCFGPPEGHLLVGQRIKRLHVIHSVCMISVFIVILARAVNTLR